MGLAPAEERTTLTITNEAEPSAMLTSDRGKMQREKKMPAVSSAREMQERGRIVDSFGAKMD